jgi:hypothetical protein
MAARTRLAVVWLASTLPLESSTPATEVVVTRVRLRRRRLTLCQQRTRLECHQPTRKFSIERPSLINSTRTKPAGSLASITPLISPMRQPLANDSTSGTPTMTDFFLAMSTYHTAREFRSNGANESNQVSWLLLMVTILLKQRKAKRSSSQRHPRILHCCFQPNSLLSRFGRNLP